MKKIHYPYIALGLGMLLLLFVIEGSKIELTRNLLFDPEQVLGVAEEEEIIYNDMIVDSARQIVQRMQALK